MDQGLWAWMTVVAAEVVHDHRRHTAAPLLPRRPVTASCPIPVSEALLGAWTDLIVGTLTHTEVPR